ncbi:hypothetical protein ABFS82_03G017500 [Erythranthe guttata]|uniref:Uncharacterized protein n=1 Tax=Erythranthe guttata TaxID=4155 RepID=A0A022R3C0_ERYGU|nr:PREDICTED: salutaridinol 7-O-acetyltransferase-like [Erythranthe guttata]EYU33330.1 hypothetical protein MIMGU_mgv1a025759mg [Erythranthe guttata]|eukprot:XP_012842281.1 PREDICTED: salutaridinol 7-O-acetyltransferase-like [Erythranthe guttata]
MEGEIISRENIKPSSPTPDDKKTHKYSLLDQIMPPVFVSLVLYYPNINNNNNIDDFICETTQILKQSLSTTLSLYKPLAGRIKDSLSIDCNDQGVLLVVVKFKENLSDFLKKPDPKACRAHIPVTLTWDEPGPGSHVAMLQVNYFSCGGVAIGSLFFHKVVDGVSVGSFMKAWAAAASGGPAAAIIPDYTAQTIFPQNESLQRENCLLSAAMRKYFRVGKTVLRRYVFDSSAISKLRAKMSRESLEGRPPSRVEVVSALIWKCFIAASSSEKNSTTSVAAHVVNMRRKADPAFLEHSFGNFLWLAPAVAAPVDDSGGDYSVEALFGKVRSAISMVDVDFVNKMQGGGELGFSGYWENLRVTLDECPEEADFLSISSWCNFGLYSVDFGWGNPVWMSRCDSGSDTEFPFLNMLWLTDTCGGDGVEAWLTLDEKCFAAFDEITEIHDLASVDPSPLSS